MYTGLFRLDGCAALVTGGGSGIGLACAEALGEADARIAISARSHDDSTKAVEYPKQKGIEVAHLSADVSSENVAQDAVWQTADAFGGLDILVDNAGIARHCDSLKLTPETWNRDNRHQPDGSFLVLPRSYRDDVAKGSGSIVNIGSISGYISNLPQNQVAYNASKTGVHMLTKSLVGKFAKNNIRINAVAPGYTETAMTQDGLDDSGWSKIWLGMTPMARAGKASEVAAVVLFLASDAASYITGSVLTIDGGCIIH